MKTCPICNHKLYGEQSQKRNCKHCGYVHDPNFKPKEESNGQNNWRSFDKLN